MNDNSKHARLITALAVAAASISIAGCYVLESARGQLSVMSKRERIGNVIARPSTPATVRRQLLTMTSIRDFASTELKLPDNGSYRSYADVGRAYVVWNVVAAPEFSVDAKQWCYPLIGCVAYRGYFSETKALAFAAKQRSAGLEVTVDGIAAYSTLGHFNDPVLNTMLGWDDVELAAIVFHELTHQLLYLPGDAAFDEALASTVEAEGVRRWLLAQGRDTDLAAYFEQQQLYRKVIDLMEQTRTRLRQLYQSGVDTDTMARGKAAMFAKLQTDYSDFQAQWHGRLPFAAAFAARMNNARLASVATYFDCVPGFERQLAAAGGDLAVFYRRVRNLAMLEQAQRDAVLCTRQSAPAVARE